jgi:hypothetical protein
MSRMGLRNWIRSLFSPNGPDDEAAEREEYGLPDRGEVELGPGRSTSFAVAEGAQVAEDDLDEFKAPPDPAP